MTEISKFITKQDYELLKQKYPKKIEKVLKKIKNNYPVQYLIGNVEFFDCIIKVNKNVLIPRFETELLIEKSIKKIQEMKINHPKIIDLGCGSGCIAIALKKHMDCEMTAVDKSTKALKVARENAKLNNLSIAFLKKDMTKLDHYFYDIIISNPPYVGRKEPVGKETKKEPQKAIFAKENGLYFYRKILEMIEKKKEKPKLIIFEIGMDQGELLKNLQRTLLPNYKITIEKDYNNRDRFAFLELHK